MHGVFAFHHQRTRAHAQNGAVPPFVKGQGGFSHHVIRGGRAQRQEARPNPFQQVVAGHIIGGNNQYTAATAVPDPILRYGNRLGGAGAGRIHLRIGATCADVLGKLAVPHRQNAEDEAPVKHIRFSRQRLAQVVDAPRDSQQSLIIGAGAAQLI